MRYLDDVRTLTPKDSGTHIALPFVVPACCETLWIRYSYTPKTLEDLQASERIIEAALTRYAPGEYRAGYGNWTDYLPLKNLATLSLDSPGGYCGCAHKQDSDMTFSVSRTEAGWGFHPPEHMEGSWRAVISCHAIVTAACETHLLIADSKEELE